MTTVLRPDIEVRLSNLPRKVRIPLQQLLSAGQISQDVLSVVMDAGELAQDRSRLLGFAVAYLFLIAQGVPITDVVRMAKHQRRRVNLSWSANRWKAEHNRLSRAATLLRLSAENVAYDVAEIASLLPEAFPGYVIRGSRRLGMEGLRQRHCVASYVGVVANGRSAIVVVFLDRQRWTVHVTKTGDARTPLRIVQMKTRLNQGATQDVARRIHSILGMAYQEPAVSPYLHAPREHVYVENLQRVLPVLRERGVDKVIVTFDGCGDSGSIDHVHFDGGDGEGDVTIVAVAHQRVDNQWVRSRQESTVTIDKAIESLTYDYLNATDVDWYNNDGGWGELVIKVDAGSVALEVNQRFTESSLEFSEELDIEAGEAA